jgi:hypothetical protein
MSWCPLILQIKSLSHRDSAESTLVDEPDSYVRSRGVVVCSRQARNSAVQRITGCGARTPAMAYGGQFNGTRAPLYLVQSAKPGMLVGSHQRGEFYVDSGGIQHP